jgi:GNAT superfamily N-acetyltransferase
MLMTEPDALLIIAHTPEEVVLGYLLAFSHPTFLANGPVVWVEEVMVAEQARHTGIGRRLMATAENWSASRGAAYVALATRRAAGFYVALGYTESATFFRKVITPSRVPR